MLCPQNADKDVCQLKKNGAKMKNKLEYQCGTHVEVTEDAFCRMQLESNRFL